MLPPDNTIEPAADFYGGYSLFLLVCMEEEEEKEEE